MVLSFVEHGLCCFLFVGFVLGFTVCLIRLFVLSAVIFHGFPFSNNVIFKCLSGLMPIAQVESHSSIMIGGGAAIGIPVDA